MWSRVLWPRARLAAFFQKYREDHRAGSVKPARRYATQLVRILFVPTLLTTLLIYTAAALVARSAARSTMHTSAAACAAQLEGTADGVCGSRVDGDTYCLWWDPHERRDYTVFYKARMRPDGGTRHRIWPHPTCAGRVMSAEHASAMTVSHQTDASAFFADTRVETPVMGSAAYCLQRLRDADEHPCDYWPLDPRIKDEPSEATLAQSAYDAAMDLLT